MSHSINSIVQFKKPEYIGENRCLPCTAVNGLIGLVASGVFGVGVFYLSGSVVGTIAAISVTLAISGIAIGQRASQLLP